MDKLKGCASKPIIIVIALILVLAGGYFAVTKLGLFGLGTSGTGKSALEKRIGDIDYDNTYSPSALFQEADYENRKVTVFGSITAMYGETLSIADESGSMQLNLENSTGDTLADGDFALLTGEYHDYYFYVETATKISEEENTQLGMDILPQMEIEILDFPKAFTHGCSHIDFKLRIKNVGRIAIPYANFVNFESKWRFGYQIEGESQNFGYSVSDNEDDKVLGLEDFGTLQPAEQKDVTFYGGGYVKSGCTEDDALCGTGGQGNIFCPFASNPTGDRSVKFVMGVIKPDSFTELNIGGESESVTVNVQSCECDLTQGE